MAATVVDQQTAIPLAKAACKRAAEAVLGDRKVVVALVDDASIAELHERYLHKSGPTDVLSFPHGEIVVSGDTARREAEARGIPPLHELVLYVVHGALHLAGHDDRKPAQQAQMRAAERRILSELGYGDVFGHAETPPKPRPSAGRPAKKKKDPMPKKRKAPQRNPRASAKEESEWERAKRGPTRRLAAAEKAKAAAAKPARKKKGAGKKPGKNTRQEGNAGAPRRER